MFGYSAPYLLVLFILMVMYFIEVSNSQNIQLKNRIRGLVVILLSFFFAFRGYVGSDWMNYSVSYELTEWNSWQMSDYEPGFSIIVKLCKFLGLEYLYMVSVITLIQFILLNHFVKRYFSSAVLPYIFIISLFPIVIIDLQRNFISILIVMNSIVFLERKETRKFYLAVIGACFFHMSAVVFLILPFLNRVRFKQTTLIALFIFGFVVYIGQINFYQELLSVLGKIFGGRIEYLVGQVTSGDEESYGISFGIVEKIVLALLIIATYYEVSKKNRLFVNMCVVYLLVYFYFSTSQSFINRFANLFMFGYIWYYIYLLIYYSHRKGFLLVVLIVFAFVFLRTSVGYNKEIYLYRNILYEEDNYFDRSAARDQYYQIRYD